MITCRNIKKLIEQKSGIDNLGVRTRKGKFPAYRFVYFKLCRKFTTVSLETIANYVNLSNHATVIYGINKYDELQGSKFLSDAESCYKEINELLTNKLNK